ncbi:MAG: glycosyltransferase family 1 protein [Oscillochloridaceae bacterium]|nr:glycosyltransferase family 4 protein [Chloroflexaceae bacterium]MDW8391787.1 glycosyltransferase family 1 protein [Oscillochloridaceae bacterium]
MHIGVDYTAAVWQGAGIGRYTRELIRAVVGLDRTITYRLFYAAGALPAASPYVADLRALRAAHPNVQLRPIPLSPRLLTILWQRLRLPLRAEALAGPMDLLHAPDFVLPPTRARTLVTVHDLTFLVRPDCAEAGLRRYLTRAVPRALRRADLVLVDSQATAADLARLLGVDGSRVRLIYPGVDARFQPLPSTALEATRARLGLPTNFLLFVGTLEPRKNLPRLVRAFARLADPELHLVIAGRRGWLYEDIFATVEQLELQNRVHMLDFVADADLPALYNLARAFVYPSLYEGFGLPVLEALACGAPVVTSGVSSLIEVAGEAAVLVDPLDEAAIADGITRALREAARLRVAGPAQARLFRWETAAQRLLACYRTLGAGEPSKGSHEHVFTERSDR